MSIFKPSIKSRVMEVISDRISEAQDSHDEELRNLEEQHEKDKESLFDRHVNRILSKIL